MRYLLPTIGEDALARRLRSDRSMHVVCVGAAECAVSRALLHDLAQHAPAYAGRITIHTLLADDAPLWCEQYLVQALPSLLVFRDGDVATRAVGFLAPGLLRLFLDQIAVGEQPHVWHPTEGAFEDAIILPLVAGWGYHAARQAPCVITRQRRSTCGRIDVLVSDPLTEQPITLFENKRDITGAYDLALAAKQAHAYAAALDLPSFVVAAPRGLWIYARHADQITLRGAFTSYAVHMQPDAIHDLIRSIARTEDREPRTKHQGTRELITDH